MEECHILAPAKINLALDVIRKREDGYHEVNMIMQTLKLFDHIDLKKGEKGITFFINKEVTGEPKENLAYRAAELFFKNRKIEPEVEIRLEKNIPVAAGMAGGSTDAAGVLLGLNELYGEPLSKEELCKIGVLLGADVPYCILQGTCLSQGIGEILTPLAPAPECSVLVAKPPIQVSTKYVYENLRANELKQHPDIAGMKQAIEKKDLKEMAKKVGNVLETVTVNAYPEIERIKEKMKEHHALASIMSGSGPTVFGLFETEDQAKKAEWNLKNDMELEFLQLTQFYQPQVG